ncbi:dipeptidase [Membranihabitans maritimus]|uniref:dipeptidase n=1 Tax=Membranihabitans maritimus TaxID=2904244 RepID=UPI001F02AD63|nr:membrane dipeptidase [Membranihabitans maritimus]
MNRRKLIKNLALMPLAGNAFTKTALSNVDLLEKSSITSLHESSGIHYPKFVMDGHIHVMSRQLLEGLDIGQRYSDGMVDLPRIKDGKINAMFFSVYTPEVYYPRHFEVKNTFRVIELALEQIQKNSDIIELATNATEIVDINKRNKIAAFLDLEGSYDMEGDLYLLRALYRLGLRSMQLTAHNESNSFIDACSGERLWNGINNKGREIIAEMNDLGMVINVAHASSEAIVQIAEASRQPVAYTHGGFRGMIDIKRNISDEAAKAVASRGGVIALQFGHYFNYPKYYNWETSKPNALALIEKPKDVKSIEEADKEVAKDLPFVSHQVIPEEYKMSVHDFVEAIDYGVQLVGEDHVALGSDFDGGLSLPKEMKDASDYPQMFIALKDKGYSQSRIDKIMGLNWLRLIKKVTEGK